jgi:hypothetical protein
MIQLVKVFPHEGRTEATHLIENAAKRPDIRLTAIRLVPPNLRTGIIRRAGLCIDKSLLVVIYLRDVEISQLINAVRNKDVRAFQVAVENRRSMKNT